MVLPWRKMKDTLFSIDIGHLPIPGEIDRYGISNILAFKKGLSDTHSKCQIRKFTQNVMDYYKGHYELDDVLL